MNDINASETPTNLFPLERSICFIDCETTGVDVERDRIIELSLLKRTVAGEEVLKTVRFNPGIPIPPEATAIHGITDEHVKHEPPFQQYAKHIWGFIQGCDIVGFNSNRFDVPLLYYALRRAGLDWDWKAVNLIDVCGIFKIKEERTLAGAVKFYFGYELADMHTAEGDLKATRNVFFAQLERYADLPKDFKDLARFSNYGHEIIDMAGKFARDEDGDIVYNFGQHKGKKARTQIHYLQWMMKGDFPQDTKDVATSILYKKLWNK